VVGKIPTVDDDVIRIGIEGNEDRGGVIPLFVVIAA
jgi:hypothetical protein